MLSLAPRNLKSILCIGCHSDDIEIGCGGTILRLLQEHPGLVVHWVVLAAAGPREEEAKQSADLFLNSAAGGERGEVMIQSFRDSYFPIQYENIKGFFHQLSGRVNPDVIFTHRREDAHQDHRVAAELTWCAFRDHVILEYEIPKYEGDLGHSNLYVPLDAGTATRKIDFLMQAFATQRSKGWFRRDVFEALMRLRGIECKSPSGWAEAFHARKLVI